MLAAVERAMEAFGTDMTVIGQTKTSPVRGFLREVNYTAWKSMESDVTLLGEVSRGQYVFLGPADVEIAEGDTLALGEKTYLFRRAERYYYQNQPIYRWGLCVEKGVNDTWGTQS